MFAGTTLTGCDADVVEGKARASTSEPAKITPPQEKPADAVEHVFSNENSTIEFTGAKVTGKHLGSLGRFSGTIQLVSNDPTKSRVGTEIDMSSLRADDEKLTEHLKSADFFDIARFPIARFESTSIRSGGENGATNTVTGNLELHGVTKSITFPATIRTGGDTVDVDAEFAIDRQDFNVTYPGMPDDLIKDEILVKLTVRAKRAS
jgi:polyisoprenoid-binding protein YceI